MASETFDGVVVQAVLEHVLCPERVVSEIRRVLKPNGLLYAETPFMQQVHEGPYDFTRYTVNGHRWLFRYFKQGSAGVVLGPATQLVWSLEHFARALFRSKALGRLVRLLFSWLRIFDAMMPDSKKEDGACGIYFLGEKSEKALAPVELVNYYNSRHRL